MGAEAPVDLATGASTLIDKFEKEALMSEVDTDYGLEYSYDVHELPPFEEYDADFVAYQRTFAMEMNQWVKLGYEPIGMASHNGRLLGFFKKRMGGR